MNYANMCCTRFCQQQHNQRFGGPETAIKKVCDRTDLGDFA